jgi:hypothetical protein
MGHCVDFATKLGAVVLMAACLGLEIQPAWAERRVAFVAGIDTYPNLPREMQLECAVADAVAMGDALQSLGFTVTRVTRDVTQETFLRRFGGVTHQIEAGDTALFFFAGHGIGLDGTNYLVPADVPKLGGGDERLVKSRSMAETDLRKPWALGRCVTEGRTPKAIDSRGPEWQEPRAGLTANARAET